MILFWFIIPFLVLMVLSGTRHQREEENDDEGGFEDKGGFEEDEESNEEDNEGGKASLTTLWKCVTKLEGGEVVEPLNFYVLMIVIKENLIPVHIPV
jgi:hypothetical protein